MKPEDCVNKLICSKCFKDLKNRDIGGFVRCLGMRKYWCVNCWEQVYKMEDNNISGDDRGNYVFEDELF